MPLLELTGDNYVCPEGEEKSYHCRIEVRKFDPDTGERMSRPKLVKLEPKFFEAFGLHHLRQQGYTVDILHNPRQWAAENAARLEAEAREREEAADKRRQAEREALKAEILAELKAENTENTENTENSNKQQKK